jgi:hypothetical protein
MSTPNEVIAEKALNELYPNVNLPKRSHAKKVILAAIEKANGRDRDDASKWRALIKRNASLRHDREIERVRRNQEAIGL